MIAEQENYKHINGWGIDADPKNEPTYPIKNYTEDDHKRINWDRPVLQQPTVEVLHSNERPGYSAVIGETLPPSGLSGKLRRYAFQFSESSYGHWLPLLLADRINELEGIADDLRNGKIPNIMAERGWNAEWKYNRLGVMRKIAVGAVAVGVIAALCKLKKRS
ncbi:hypothetical protein [Sphingobacterium pedocola]|uniref:Uncharacterized protein n=1 Tax=Sphingobacterium pedocola TaxID=2082722 RepID=A0ABR9TAV4_9SPHI|nr:hypothetical protein [Sphingobacterium pedocola]MBE8722465.1 hypothetical protein [Sphingobacterium pedocola]